MLSKKKRSTQGQVIISNQVDGKQGLLHPVNIWKGETSDAKHSLIENVLFFHFGPKSIACRDVPPKLPIDVW